MGVYDVQPTELIIRTAEELKRIPDIKPPAWAQFARTGVFKERAPVQSDWWYIRSAAVLRKILVFGPIGVSKLRMQYGGKKNRGSKPERFYKGSGSVIRNILQQLEKAGLAVNAEKGLRKGRIISAKGHKLLESVAYQIMKERGIVIPKGPERPKVKIPVEKKKRKRAPRKKKETTKKKTTKKKEVKEEAEEIKESKEKVEEEKVAEGKAEEIKVEEKK